MSAKLRVVAACLAASCLVGWCATRSPSARGQQAAPAAAGKWDYKVGAIQYAEEGGAKNVFFVELPTGQAEVQIKKFSEMADEGWEYVGPANVYDVMVFDKEKLMPATVLRRPR